MFISFLLTELSYAAEMKMDRHGFTLIELSIVLVIVALLVAGILVGRDMIKSAEIRSQISQLERYSTAANAFRNKYNCIAGDCANAVNFNLGVASHPGGNGNGDGKIYSQVAMFATNYGTNSAEAFNFWYHLSQAGMLDQNVNGYPSAGHPGNSFVGDFTGFAPRGKLHTTFINANTIDDTSQGDAAFGNAFTLTGQNLASPSYARGITAMEAYSIDSKLDDGLPHTGTVRTLYTYAGPRVTGDYFGCAIGGASPVYDVQGLYLSYGSATLNTPPNPGQIGCLLALTNRF